MCIQGKYVRKRGKFIFGDRIRNSVRRKVSMADEEKMSPEGLSSKQIQTNETETGTHVVHPNVSARPDINAASGQGTGRGMYPDLTSSEPIQEGTVRIPNLEEAMTQYTGNHFGTTGIPEDEFFDEPDDEYGNPVQSAAAVSPVPAKETSAKTTGKTSAKTSGKTSAKTSGKTSARSASPSANKSASSSAKKSNKKKKRGKRSYGNPVMDVLLNNLRVLIPAAVALAIVICVILVISARKKTAAQQAAQTQESGPAVETVEMKLNAYEDLNALIETYFDAYAEGDTETLSQITNGLDDEDLMRIQEISKFIDYYTTIDVYSKDGLYPGTYIVYAYTEEMLMDYANAVPGLTTMYVSTDDDGNLYIDAGTQSDDVTNYIQTVTVQDDAIDLNNRVAAEYNDLIAGDPDFDNYLDQITETVNIAVAQRLAQQASEEQAAQEAQSEEIQEPEEEAQPTYLVAQDVVNIRDQASQEGEILSQTAVGDKYELLESLSSGWSRISYDGKDAYVMTQFFNVENSDGTQEQAGTTEVIGTAEVKESVRMRDAANTNANVIMTLYTGATVEVTGTSGDWTAVIYNGQAGYIKSEFLKTN